MAGTIPPWRAHYRPVAVTPHNSENASDELAGKMGRLTPDPCNAARDMGALGHTAPPLALQLIDEQLRPVVVGSFSTLPSAAAGPLLLAVMV